MTLLNDIAFRKSPRPRENRVTEMKKPKYDPGFELGLL